MSAYGLLGAVAGLILGTMVWRLFAPIMAAPLFARKNFRDRELVTSAGLILGPLALVQVAVAAVWFEFQSWGSEIATGVIAAALLTLPLVLFGLLDDLAGNGEIRGLSGHLRSALAGQVTTGLVKLIGIVTASLWAATVVPRTAGALELVRVALVLILCANLGNLFDLAPARATKVALLVWLPVVIAGLGEAALFGPSFVIGGVLALLASDLKERSMLGDAGANTLGGLVGLCLVFTLGSVGQWVTVGVCLSLTLISELVSFSKVIRSTPPLSWLDLLGREALEISREAVDGNEG